MKRTSWLLVGFVGLAALLCSCGGGGGGKTLSTITIAPKNVTIAVGATQQFTATGTYSDGSTVDITATVTWTSSEPSRVTIDASGLATAVALGFATITATLDGQLDFTTLTVSSSGSLADVDIVFTCKKTGDFDLCGMKADGTGKTLLKAANAFDASDEFQAMAFSADGNFIAYQAHCGTNSIIRVMGSDLGDPTDLTPCNGKSAYRPAFSPDGTKIAFIASHWTDEEKGEYLYLMNSDGTDPHRVTDIYGTYNPSDNSPSFSSDGTRIVFYTNRGGASYLATIKPDGSEYQYFEGGTMGGSPVPSNPMVDWVTGRIYYASADVDVLGNTRNIYSISLTGTDKTALTTVSDYSLDNPSVSQDGSMVVFTQAVGFSTNIQLLNIGTGAVTTISDPAFDSYNEWPVFVRR